MICLPLFCPYTISIKRKQTKICIVLACFEFDYLLLDISKQTRGSLSLSR